MSTRSNLKTQLQDLVSQLVAGGLTLGQARREFERQFLIAAMRANSGSMGHSARALGVHRNTLRNRLVALEVKPADYAPKRLGPASNHKKS